MEIMGRLEFHFTYKTVTIPFLPLFNRLLHIEFELTTIILTYKLT